jgi:hypothetical protein
LNRTKIVIVTGKWNPRTRENFVNPDHLYEFVLQWVVIRELNLLLAGKECPLWLDDRLAGGIATIANDRYLRVRIKPFAFFGYDS